MSERRNIFASLSLADSTATGAKASQLNYVPAFLADPRAFLDQHATPLIVGDEDRSIMLSGVFGRSSTELTFTMKLTGEDASPTVLNWLSDADSQCSARWGIKEWILTELPNLFAYVGAPRGNVSSNQEYWFGRAADEIERFRYFMPYTIPIFDNDGRSAVEACQAAAFYATLGEITRWPFDVGSSFGVEPNPVLDPAPASQRPVNVFEFSRPQYCCASVRCWEAADANPARFLTLEACVERGMIPLVTVIGGEFREKSDRLEQGAKWGDRLASIEPLGKVFVGGIERSDLLAMRGADHD